MIGQFAQPVRLAEAMRTDGALFAAYRNRLAPLRCLGTRLVPSVAPGGDYVARDLAGHFGPKGVGVSRATIADIQGCYANHGTAIGYNAVTPSADGRRWDFVHHYWPMEFVWWHSVAQCYMTRVRNWGGNTPSLGGINGQPQDPYGTSQNNGFSIVPITHGDGRWTVYQSHEVKAFTQDAAIIPASLMWGVHGHSWRDWAKGSSSHGNAKVVGELPEGVPLLDANGISPGAASFLELVQAIASMDTPAGIRAFGTKIDYIMNTSNAWQVWDTLAQRAEKIIARIYLGTDGALGAGGGAPGVDLTQMFNVDATIVQGDIDVITDGFQEGVIDPCCAVNYGDSSCAPSREYIVPDADLEAVQKGYAARDAAFQAAIKQAKENGFVVDQKFVEMAAKEYGVNPPALAVSAPSGADFYAYELEGGVVTIDEVRARKGLPPLPNGAGAMTVPQAKAVAAAGGLPVPVVPQLPATPTETPTEQPESEPTVSEEDEPMPAQGAALAAKMTELAIQKCQHGYSNRCRICGIERERDVELSEEGEPVWAVKWKAIQ